MSARDELVEDILAIDGPAIIGVDVTADALLAAGYRSPRRLLAAIEAVRAVHEPIDAVMYSGEQAHKVQVCTGCGQDDGNWQQYPCPTVRAVAKALREQR